MKFAILDAHGNVLLEWDVDVIALSAYPRPVLHRRARRRFARRLVSALEAKKLDLFAL